MFEAFLKEKLAPLALRLALGLVCVYHGFLKIMATGGLTWHLTMPTVWQLLIAWGEFAAGVAILIGLRCRVAAAAALTVVLAAQAYDKGWGILQQPVRSLEPLLVLTLAGLALLFLGAGELSLDGQKSGGASRGTKKKAAA
ncbi:MAG: DoxX family membrane protein [Gemmataceae bacterium]|nr:DoxX family membrane protein [Gemmataceae bacterium]